MFQKFFSYRTFSIIKDYKAYNIYNTMISEDVKSSYDAINKGFALLHADRINFAERSIRIFNKGKKLSKYVKDDDKDIINKMIKCGIKQATNPSIPHCGCAISK